MAVWADLIICGVTPGEGVNPNYIHECQFADIFALIGNLITDLVLISTLLAVIAFIYAGFKLLTSQGNPGAMKDAMAMLRKVIIGYVWILAAWLIVYTISKALLGNFDAYSFLGKPIKN
jgi:hypothetical protein